MASLQVTVGGTVIWGLSHLAVDSVTVSLK